MGIKKKNKKIAMIDNFVKYFEYNGIPASPHHDFLVFGQHQIPIRNGIPRFTPDVSYSTGNFSQLREKHATLQLDSHNLTTDRYDTILKRTNWPKSFFKDKTILECGCGAGPDTEILLFLEARVLAVDISSIDKARINLGQNKNLCLVQADITDLPLKKKSFDVVFCHRVLQHTPSPEHTLRHILQFVKVGGAVFVHSYAKTFFQMCNWKYALRLLTTRMNPEKLYNVIKYYAPTAFKITNVISKLPKGDSINHFLFPFRNHRRVDKFKKLSDAQIIEYGIHDTFDALSPRYDNPISAKAMCRIGEEILGIPFEVAKGRAITLLRTILERY